MVISEDKRPSVVVERESYGAGLRRHMINRIMSGEREREQREGPVQPLNVNRILNQMQ